MPGTAVPRTEVPRTRGPRTPGPRTLNGAQILCESLLKEGADLIFGYPGGAILPTYDALTEYPAIHHVLTRHEQGATHMADGFARATGKVGVVMATSGPGATNLVTGLATAMMDSSPIVAITGQVPLPLVGTDAFQETDVTGVTLPITKHNYLVTDVADLAHIVKEAFHIARTGRPGPVLIDIPKDIQMAETPFIWPEEPVRLPGYRPPATADPVRVGSALELIKAAKRPLILAGHGILMADAVDQLRHYAEATHTPVALTLLGKSCMSEEHPLCFGMMGMHGNAHVNEAIQQADLLIALGMRFDDRVTGNLATYAQSAKKIHIDIDATEINKNVPVDIGIVGDAKVVMQELLSQLNDTNVEPNPEWVDQIRTWQLDSDRRELIRDDQEPLDDRPGLDPKKLLAGQVMRDLCKYTKGEAVTVTDVGQHQMFEAQYYQHKRPRTLITSGGLGTMGFGVPAAIGAKMGTDDSVWAIAGDGGFQMTMMELATAVQERVNVKVAVINNGFLGMVRQWQEFFYDERYHATPMVNPDFCKLAEAFGIPTRRVTQRSQVKDAVLWAESITEGPVFVEFVVEKEDIVYPMVPAGAALNEMIRRPIPGQEEAVPEIALGTVANSGV